MRIKDMTNQTTEILELAKKCGAEVAPIPGSQCDSSMITFTDMTFLAFTSIYTSALRSQDAAKVEMLVDALIAARTSLHNPFEPDNQSRAWLAVNAALSAAQPSAAAYVAEVEARALANSPLQQLIAAHSELLEYNPYCYFELAYTRRTEWMAWLCTKPQEDDPQRIVLAKGQGSTPDEAAKDALENMAEKRKQAEQGEGGK